MPNGIRTGLISALFLAVLGVSTASASALMGYFGLVSTQMAKVYVANPLSDFSCSAQIQLVDTQGMPVATGEMVMVGPGKSTSLQVSGAAIASAGRMELRPIVKFIPPEPGRAAALVSAEVMDQAIGGGVHVFWPPGPERGSPVMPIRFGLIDLSSGQVARLVAVNLWPPGPIKLLMRFFDATGTILSSQTVTVAPGTAAMLDFMMPTTTTTTAARAASTTTDPTCTTCIRADVSLVTPNSPAIRFLASAEIIDSVSGATTVAWPPSPLLPASED